MSRGCGTQFKDGSTHSLIEEKKDHVRQARQTRLHECHWIGCKVQVPPAKWGCFKHWMMLPKYLRDKVWLTYRISQEDNYTPSREYVAVAKEVQLWISCEISGL